MTKISECVLEDQLLVLSEINHKLEQMVTMGGRDSLTPPRITEMVAGSIMPDRTVRLCPGYGDTHIWAWTVDVARRQPDFIERCEKHPERRAAERRKR